MNETAVLAVTGAVVAALVIWPLLRRGSSPGARPGATPSAPDEAPDELAELEMDRAMGRVSDADYERLAARLAGAATAGPAEARDAGEDAASPAPAASAAPASSRAEDLVRRWREAPRPVCASCGVRPEPAARFCSRCGAPVA